MRYFYCALAGGVIGTAFMWFVQDVWPQIVVASYVGKYGW